MGKINVLDKKTVDQIAAGEVVERPSSVVKELVENAIDAGASSISVETKNGGIDLIRVTDDGPGILREDIPVAFKAHATSKIRSIEDLDTVFSLGFRGEALSSIASVSEVELITKTKEDLVGTSYEIRGSAFISENEIGAPDGTTMIVRNLFFNTPARRKFLKTPMTESAYIGDLMERFALSHPSIRFKWTNGGQVRLATSGSGQTKELIYQIYGRDAANAVVECVYEEDGVRIDGFLGKPVVSRGNRSAEHYFINGRYVRSKIIDKAIEDAYAPYMMLHRYPFTVLYLQMNPAEYDVNVHPTKMELRFRSEAVIYDHVYRAVSEGLREREYIVDVPLSEEKKKEDTVYEVPEPFEAVRIKEESRYKTSGKEETKEPERKIVTPEQPLFRQDPQKKGEDGKIGTEQLTFDGGFLGNVQKKNYRLIGQLFKTYWLIEIGDALYILDQHAAHEKVLFERNVKAFGEKRIASQYITPPILLSVTEQEEMILNRYADTFTQFGFEIRSFGQKSFAVSAVPADLYGLDLKGIFMEILAGLSEEFSTLRSDTLYLKLATMSCKAAVKGHDALSLEEADKLISELLTLENPFACPHGRPTLISITRSELEKKFKRIV